jgi:hypothetical protein
MADSVTASRAGIVAAAAPLLPVVSASSAAEEKDREGGITVIQRPILSQRLWELARMDSAAQTRLEASQSVILYEVEGRCAAAALESGFLRFPESAAELDLPAARADGQPLQVVDMSYCTPRCMHSLSPTLRQLL